MLQASKLLFLVQRNMYRALEYPKYIPLYGRNGVTRMEQNCPRMQNICKVPSATGDPANCRALPVVRLDNLPRISPRKRWRRETPAGNLSRVWAFALLRSRYQVQFVAPGVGLVRPRQAQNIQIWFERRVRQRSTHSRVPDTMQHASASLSKSPGMNGINPQWNVVTQSGATTM